MFNLLVVDILIYFTELSSENVVSEETLKYSAIETTKEIETNQILVENNLSVFVETLKDSLPNIQNFRRPILWYLPLDEILVISFVFNRSHMMTVIETIFICATQTKFYSENFNFRAECLHSDSQSFKIKRTERRIVCIECIEFRFSKSLMPVSCTTELKKQLFYI
uniref:PiggyBac transposable element-derived protein domain-containing protein n=1 Tax=Glossina austeni TaxID=7395 RepID=A0A1A9V5J4_GLOAU